MKNKSLLSKRYESQIYLLFICLANLLIVKTIKTDAQKNHGQFKVRFNGKMISRKRQWWFEWFKLLEEKVGLGFGCYGGITQLSLKIL